MYDLFFCVFSICIKNPCLFALFLIPRGSEHFQYNFLFVSFMIIYYSRFMPEL